MTDSIGNSLLANFEENERKKKTGFKKLTNSTSPKSAKNMKAAGNSFKKGALTQTDIFNNERFEAAMQNINGLKKMQEAERNVNSIEDVLDNIGNVDPKYLRTKQGLEAMRSINPTMTDEQLVNNFLPMIEKRNQGIKMLKEMPFGTKLTPEQQQQFKDMKITKPGKHMSFLKLMTNSLGAAAGKVGAADISAKKQTFLAGPGMSYLEQEKEKQNDLKSENIRYIKGVVDGKVGWFKAGDKGTVTDLSGKSVNNLIAPDGRPVTFTGADGYKYTYNPNTNTTKRVEEKLPGLNPTQRKDLLNTQDEVSKNVNQYVESANAVVGVRKLLESKNPVAKGMIQRLFLKASGEDRYTDQDLKSFAGAEDLWNTAKQIWETKTEGDFSPENRKMFIKLAKTLETVSKNNIKKQHNIHFGDLLDRGTIEPGRIRELQKKSISRYNQISGEETTVEPSTPTKESQTDKPVEQPNVKEILHKTGMDNDKIEKLLRTLSAEEIIARLKKAGKI